MRPNRKARRAAKFQGAEKGFGPRHAFNAQEGDELVPEELPTPPTGPPDRGDRLRRMILDQVIDPETRAEIARNPTGAKAMAAYASLGIMLMPGHEGGAPRGVPKSAKVPQPGLKVPDMAPRYEGPPETGQLEKIQDSLDSGKNLQGDAQIKHWQDYWAKHEEQFPSLNKPPYDALKEEPPLGHGKTEAEITDEEMFDAMAGYKSPHNELTPETWHPKWEDLPDDVKREYPNPDIMTETDWAKIKEHLDQPPEQKYTHWLGEPVPEAKDPSFSPEEVQKMEDLKDFLKPPKGPPAFPPSKFQADWQTRHSRGLLPPKDDLGALTPEEQAAADFAEKNPHHKAGDAEKKEFLEAMGETGPGDEWKADQVLENFNNLLDKLPIEKNPTGPVDAPLPDWVKDHLPPEPPQFEPRNPDDPFDRMPGSQGFPEYARGTKGVRQPRKFRAYPPVRKVGVAKGFGPRHAENAKEGDLTKVNTDTVPAMLTPREAVLNRNAAELAGRGNIEQLNEQGNELAKKGVDLAARGDSDVSEETRRQDQEDEALAKRVFNRFPFPPGHKGPQTHPGSGSPSESFFWKQLMGPQGRLEPEEEVYPDFIKLRQELSMDPMMAQKGTANMKPKPKSPPSKPKPAPKPEKPQSGSPYVQGFQKLMPQGLQGGGYAADESMPGLRNRNFPHPMAGKMHPSMPGLGGTGMQPYAPPPLQGVGGPGILGEGTRNFPHPMAGLMHPGADIGQPAPYIPPGGLGNFPTGGGTNWMPPMGGGGGEPPGAYGAKPFQMPNLKGYGSGSFYPKGGAGYASGTENVLPVGAANPEHAYGEPINLTAGDLSKFAQAAQAAGLSPGQIAGLTKMFSGIGGGAGNANAPGTGTLIDSGGMAYPTTGGYQGGISEVGYPPGIAPNADFSYEEGGWTGPLDPRWSSPGYARGSGDVGNFAANPELFYGPDFKFSGSGFHGGGGFSNRSSYNPGGSFSGAPGFPWSPTKIPTSYDPQGYPYGVPVQGPDQNLQGVGRTHNLRKNQ